MRPFKLTRIDPSACDTPIFVIPQHVTKTDGTGVIPVLFGLQLGFWTCYRVRTNQHEWTEHFRGGGDSSHARPSKSALKMHPLKAEVSGYAVAAGESRTSSAVF